MTDQTGPWWMRELRSKLTEFLDDPSDHRDHLLDMMTAYRIFAELYPEDVPGVRLSQKERNVTTREDWWREELTDRLTAFVGNPEANTKQLENVADQYLVERLQDQHR